MLGQLTEHFVFEFRHYVIISVQNWLKTAISQSPFKYRNNQRKHFGYTGWTCHQKETHWLTITGHIFILNKLNRAIRTMILRGLTAFACLKNASGQMRNRVAVIISSRLFQRHGKYETHATCLLLWVSSPHPCTKIARLKIYGSAIIHGSDILLIET